MANEKKVALVTGSNRGIGFETARQLGQQGVRVLVTARTEREAADAASKLRSEGIEAEALALDVTNAADRAVAAEFVESRYGKLDILVNNAGVGPADGLIGLRASESTEDELQSIFNINMFSLVALTREFLPLLKKSDAGRIVNLGSILGSPSQCSAEFRPLSKRRTRIGRTNDKEAVRCCKRVSAQPSVYHDSNPSQCHKVPSQPCNPIAEARVHSLRRVWSYLCAEMLRAIRRATKIDSTRAFRLHDPTADVSG